jgi:Fe-S cluster assembly protein SufD
MTDLLTPQLNIETEVPDWLQARRLAGRATWDNSSLPTRKTEDWKYTSLFPLQQDFTAAPVSDASATELGLDLPELSGSRLVFVNGHWREDLSTLSSDAALQVVRFSEADDEQSALISEHLGTTVPSAKHLFAMLNDAALTDGVFLRVRANSKAQHPVQLVWHNSHSENAFISNQRLLVLAEPHSEASLVEHFSGSDTAFTNGVTELVLGPGRQAQS